MPQWPRLMAASWAWLAWVTVSDVTAQQVGRVGSTWVIVGYLYCHITVSDGKLGG